MLYARAPAGRCKGMHLHPLEFVFSDTRLIHAQNLTQRHHQSLFYRVKYNAYVAVPQVDRYAIQPFTSTSLHHLLEKSCGRPWLYVVDFVLCIAFIFLVNVKNQFSEIFLKFYILETTKNFSLIFVLLHL